tara:strand:+ start:309 stop:749 length:441 start_codon:yes stop_codon:yes gene_type:complete
MIEISSTNKSLSITHNNKTIEVKPSSTNSITISKLGAQGLKGDTGGFATPSDNEVIAQAESGDKVASYNGIILDKIEGISYEDINGASNHTKTFNYGTVAGEEVVATIVSVFGYSGENWTVTKTINYDAVGGAPLWAGTDINIIKT